MRMATCHPDRKHFAKGMCVSCHHCSWRKSKGYVSPNKKAQDLKYYLANRDKRCARSREWAIRNPEKARVRLLRWQKANKDHAKEYRSNRLKRLLREDQNFIIKKNLRTRMYRALHGIVKIGRTHELLGCSISDFKMYIESKFEPGMSWDNYGVIWEIDHIMPCAIFDLTKPEHQRRCFHFSNLQPLTVGDNRRKRAKVLTSQFQLL